jgi:hypothetical protein
MTQGLTAANNINRPNVHLISSRLTTNQVTTIYYVIAIPKMMADTVPVALIRESTDTGQRESSARSKKDAGGPNFQEAVSSLAEHQPFRQNKIKTV